MNLSNWKYLGTVVPDIMFNLSPNDATNLPANIEPNDLIARKGQFQESAE